MDLRRIFALLGGVFLPLTIPISAQEEKPPVVPYLQPTVMQVPRHIDLTGHIEAPRVDLRARVTGYLEKIHVEEGTDVKAGDLLFEIDSRPYRIEVERAEAQFRVGEARLRRTETDLARAKALLLKSAISLEEFEKITADRSTAEAEIAATKAACNWLNSTWNTPASRPPSQGVSVATDRCGKPGEG